MGAGPRVDRDQRPEMDDREAIGVDGAPGLLGHEVIHDAEKARGEEETNRVVAIPPLRHRILHAGKYLHRLGAKEGNRNRDPTLKKKIWIRASI